MTETNSATGWFGPAKTVVPVGIPASKINLLTTALGANASDTGEWEQNDAPEVMVSCKADVAGTLYFDFSNDAVNVDTFPSVGFAVAANTHEIHTATKGPRYFRVRYTNGASAQSSLRVYTYYGTFDQLNSPLNSTISADADARIVRSVGADLDLAFGRFGGMVEDAKFGYVTGIDALDNAFDVWNFANDTLSIRSDTKTFQTSAGTIWAASDDTGDNDVTITAEYLNAAGTLTTEAVALAGRTRVRVSDTGDGIDCNRIYESGSVQATGNVYITYGTDTGSGEPNDTSIVIAYMLAGQGQSEQATYTVPAGKQMRIKRIIITVARASGAAGSAIVSLRTRLSGGTWITKRYWNLANGNFIKEASGLIFAALTNVAMRVEDVSDTDTNVTAEWHYDLVDV